MTWLQDYRFSEPLRDLRNGAEEATQLRAEVLRELGPGHLLHGVELQVVARALPQDDVVVETLDGRVALVHLTWSGRRESLPWPTTEIVDSPGHLHSMLEFRY